MHPTLSCFELCSLNNKSCCHHCVVCKRRFIGESCISYCQHVASYYVISFKQKNEVTYREGGESTVGDAIGVGSDGYNRGKGEGRGSNVYLGMP